ncbi:MAG: tetratricopeptide repeat protein [Chloroflexota bacterium]
MQLAANLPDSFGAALRFLRKRARLTQDELGRAVGYSREQIARLENGSRLPDLVVIAALFVPALLLERERALVEQFLALAGQTRRDQQIIISHTKETRVQLIQETLAAPAHTPPAPLLPLLGRQAEVNDLLTRLQTARLLTIVGAPGIGKTRLALEVAQLALNQFADGVVFVSLAEVATPADIPYAVLHHLDLTPAPQQTPTAAILDYLAARCLLLVMDNCEHLLEGITLLADWLARAPRLKLLCTSRTPLDLYGEHEWPLAPLAAPDLAETPNLERWAQFPAVQLLLARAQAANPAFALTEDNLLPLATLCAALDGLPLALELAAVRLRELAPELLVQQLLSLRGPGQLSSTWLQQTRRNVAERHRTLQAAISWSVHLLPPAAETAFIRLGVFVGGCTEAAANDVALADPALLAQLVRANLIQVENGRFHLLETLRSFALEQLAATNELHACQQEHARCYARFAQDVFAGLRGDEQPLWMQRALADHDNCLAAVRWALAEQDGETAVAIAGGLWWFWNRRGLFALGRELLTAALQLPSTDLARRAAALNGLASFCLVDEDYAANFAYHEEGLALRRQLKDTEGVATVLHNMGLTAFTMGNYEQAMAWLQESITVFPEDATSAWAHLGLIAQETQDLPQAKVWLEKAYEQAMLESEGWMQAFVMNFLADVLREMGDFDQSASLAQESLRLFSELDDSYYLPDAQMTLAQIAFDQGDNATAARLAAIVRDQYESRDDPAFLTSVLILQAELAWNMGAYDEARALFARSHTLRHTVKRAISPREQAQFAALAKLMSL